MPMPTDPTTQVSRHGAQSGPLRRRALRLLGSARTWLAMLASVASWTQSAWAPNAASVLHAGEADYYRIVTLPVPEDLRLEVGGIATTDEGRLAVATRRGEVLWVDGAFAVDPSKRVTYSRFALGLHEPLGLAYRNGSFFVVQRSELTRLRDENGDGKADLYETVAKPWGVTGNYHEYAYGPVFDADGDAWITLNATLGKKVVPDDRWRGWSLKVAPDGRWAPQSAGLRSPCGIGSNSAGDIFFTDQQGNWVPTCSLQHIEAGDFHGHVESLKDCKRPESPLRRPREIPSGVLIPEAARRIPGFKLPAVWFPYRKMGQASTDIACDETGGRFGPFSGQLFVGDFTQSLISRVFLEKVDGVYQGACFPFRRGFQCAVLRLAWGPDGSLLVGETNRGWNSLGPRSYGLERLVWTGKTPFEVHSMAARPDGFELRFTLPVDKSLAATVEVYRMESYTYRYHSTYGSPELDKATLNLRSAAVSDDGLRVRLVVEGLRLGYVHELHLDGVRSADGAPLLHPVAYYTLNRLPKT